jgi:hypothetical protein
MSRRSDIGPVFFDATVHAERHHDILMHVIALLEVE